MQDDNLETAYTHYIDFYPSQSKMSSTEKDLHQYKINPFIIVFHMREMLSFDDVKIVSYKRKGMAHITQHVW